ncbi:acetoin dehydrogenase [Thermus parvatiensis]|uniref:Acetoin dehydrogenase n=1 Tax=Thermus parvatiensis TaxID=456163 RepID=H7GF87_9DEIN|nr:acetoin utilization AcuB family protein [Thermus parvatiensis]AMA75962.1 acetoin dehydrogenase [Thermus parvatiensis]EIA39399.1 acetoin dehydrogenase AcuB [Thermus parvatiensis]
MLVRDVMRHPVFTVGPETTLEEAYRFLLEKGIRHLPVVQDGRLVGIITDRDIRLATSHLNPKGPCPGCTRVEEVMTRGVVTAHPLDPVEEAARVMRERKIGCLPVLEDGELVGIVTGIDLLDGLLRLTGVTEPSGRLEVRLPDRVGELARLTGFLAGRGVNIHSLLSYPEDGDYVRAVVRVNTLEAHLLAEALRREGFEVLWPPKKPW